MDIFKNMGGFKQGEMAIISAGRRTGKSSYYQSLLRGQNNMFQKVDEAVVDGEEWYTISTTKFEVAHWLRSQPASMIKELSTGQHTLGAYFDISEKLYVMLDLKFK